jgi:regulatory protein
MRITAIESRRGGRTHTLILDNVLAVPVSRDIMQQFALRPHDEVSHERLHEVAEAEARHFAMSSAVRLLAYRPRTEREMRDRLTSKGVRTNVLDETLARLRELRLIDDAAFAQGWVERREAASPRSRRLVAWELREKGVGAQLAVQSAQCVDEAQAAYRAASRRASALASPAYPQFRRRLGDFLARRGFDYETTSRVIARLWEELRGAGPPAEDAEQI